MADAFASIASGGAHRPARGNFEAVAEIRRCAGTQFDPRVVEALVSVYREEGQPA